MRYVKILLCIITIQVTYSQPGGIEYPFEVSNIFIDGKSISEISDEFNILIYAVDKENNVRFQFNRYPRNLDLNSNKKSLLSWGIPIPVPKSIDWTNFKFIVIEISVLKIGASKSRIMQILIDLKNVPNANEWLKISNLEFKNGYYTINQFKYQNSQQSHYMDLTNSIERMLRKEIKRYFTLKSEWNY
tara:strand:+ start:419 stop:982 length:564 start_codon:yes stop_codon:yes gene_type:complete